MNDMDKTSDFPKGYKKRNGMFYKTDDAGNVIKICNLFGIDITALLVDANDILTYAIPRIKK